MKFLIVLIIFFLLPLLLAGEGYSEHYFGMHLDYSFMTDWEAPVGEFIISRYLGAGISYGYGSGFFRPRARFSLAWLESGGFSPSLGLEIPLFEALSTARTKFFGLYMTADIGLSFSARELLFYQISPYVRIPLGPIEGLGLGVLWNSRNQWGAFITRSIGVYPLNNQH